MSNSSNFAYLTYAVRDSAAWITLNRPEKLNAFTVQAYADLRSAIRLATIDDAVEAIVITGAGRAFSAGGDLAESHTRISSNDPLAIYEFQDNLPFDVLRECPKVTIAAVNGLAMGGGFMIALACDILVAAESATFAVPEGRVGLAEARTPALLLGRVSLAHIPYMLLTGNSFSAREAERLGIVSFVVADEELMSFSAKVVGDVCETTPAARQHYKEYLLRLVTSGPTSREISGFSRVGSSDNQDGLKKFQNRDAGPSAPAKIVD